MKKQSTPWKFGKAATMIVVVTVVSLYVAVFFMLRQRVTFTMIDAEKNEAATLYCYYFSDTPSINRSLYVIFWPIHHLALRGEAMPDNLGEREAFKLARERRPIYAFNRRSIPH